MEWRAFRAFFARVYLLISVNCRALANLFDWPLQTMIRILPRHLSLLCPNLDLLLLPSLRSLSLISSYRFSRWVRPKHLTWRWRRIRLWVLRFNQLLFHPLKLGQDSLVCFWDRSDILVRGLQKSVFLYILKFLLELLMLILHLLLLGLKHILFHVIVRLFEVL